MTTCSLLILGIHVGLVSMINISIREMGPLFGFSTLDFSEVDLEPNTVSTSASATIKVVEMPFQQPTQPHSEPPTTQRRTTTKNIVSKIVPLKENKIDPVFVGYIAQLKSFLDALEVKLEYDNNSTNYNRIDSGLLKNILKLNTYLKEKGLKLVLKNDKDNTLSTGNVLMFLNKSKQYSRESRDDENETSEEDSSTDENVKTNEYTKDMYLDINKTIKYIRDTIEKKADIKTNEINKIADIKTNEINKIADIKTKAGRIKNIQDAQTNFDLRQDVKVFGMNKNTSKQFKNVTVKHDAVSTLRKNISEQFKNVTENHDAESTLGKNISSTTSIISNTTTEHSVTEDLSSFQVLKSKSPFVTMKPMSGKAPVVTLSDGNIMPMLAVGTGRGAATGVEIKHVQQAIYWAIEAGYRHIDTAAAYNDELEIGTGIHNAIADELVTREELFVTTKLWNDKHNQEQVVPALLQSLRKLRLRYVDLYLIHFPISTLVDGSPSNVDYLETWKGMEEAVTLGLAKSIGVSNFNANQLDRLMSSPTVKIRPVVNQIEVNPTMTNDGLVTHCQHKNVVVMGYSPFGFMVNRRRPDTPPPTFNDPTLLKIARKYGKTTSQVVLRYLIDRHVVPIPKTANKDRIKKNIDIFDFKLTSEEIETINAFNRHKRVIEPRDWQNYPNYPFEKS